MTPDSVQTHQSAPAPTAAQAALLAAEAAEREAASKDAMRAVLAACDQVLRERGAASGGHAAGASDVEIADLPVGAVGG